MKTSACSHTRTLSLDHHENVSSGERVFRKTCPQDIPDGVSCLLLDVVGSPAVMEALWQLILEPEHRRVSLKLITAELWFCGRCLSMTPRTQFYCLWFPGCSVPHVDSLNTRIENGVKLKRLNEKGFWFS